MSAESVEARVRVFLLRGLLGQINNLLGWQTQPVGSECRQVFSRLSLNRPLMKEVVELAAVCSKALEQETLPEQEYESLSAQWMSVLEKLFPKQ